MLKHSNIVIVVDKNTMDSKGFYFLVSVALELSEMFTKIGQPCNLELERRKVKVSSYDDFILDLTIFEHHTNENNNCKLHIGNNKITKEIVLSIKNKFEDEFFDDVSIEEFNNIFVNELKHLTIDMNIIDKCQYKKLNIKRIAKAIAEGVSGVNF